MNKSEKAALDDLLQWRNETRRLDDEIALQRERIEKLEAVLLLALKQTENKTHPAPSWISAAEIVLRAPL